MVRPVCVDTVVANQGLQRGQPQAGGGGAGEAGGGAGGGGWEQRVGEGGQHSLRKCSQG
jgi:hypothetical protein